MTFDRTSQAIALVLAAQAAEAARAAPPRLDAALVDRIRARSEQPRRMLLIPPLPEVDEETRMAARDGHEGGISPELEAELRSEEEADDVDPRPE